MTLQEEIAIAISGSPFPSKKSMAKAQAAIDVVERRLFDEVNMMILAVRVTQECQKEDVTTRKLADCIINEAWQAVKEGE